MTERMVAVHLQTAERAYVDAYLERSGENMSSLIREAVALGTGRVRARIVTTGYAPLVDALNSVGSALNGAAHNANQSAARYSRLRNIKGRDIDEMLRYLKAARDCAVTCDGRVGEVTAAAEPLLTCERFVLARPQGPVTSHALARVSEDDYIAVGAAAGAQGKTKSSFVRDLMMLVCAFGGVGRIAGRQVAIIREFDVARVEHAVMRWETNEAQIPVALERTRRTHEFSAQLDSIAAQDLVDYCDACCAYVTHACDSMRAAVAPFRAEAVS